MKRFGSKIPIWLFALLALVSPAQTFACATCYGESDAPMARGAAIAIVMLGVVVFSVLGAVVAFFVHVRRKSAALSASSESV